MAKISIVVSNGKLSVTTPYHPTMVAGSRRLHGTWTGSSWEFDPRDEDRVRALVLDLYGTDGTPCQLVDVRINVRQWYKHPAGSGDDRTMYFAGREVCHRPSRDAQVKLGEGVVLIAGEFFSSGGSVKYPRLDIESLKEDVVVEIRDVPAGHSHIVNCGELDGVTVLNSTPDVEALLAERAALLARVGEIGAILSEIEAAEQS